MIVTFHFGGAWRTSVVLLFLALFALPAFGYGAKAKAQLDDYSAAEIANAPECRTYPGGQDSYLCRCLPGFRQNRVWGSGPYTTDSNICTAALHAGAITPRGGPVVALGAPGQDSYTGSQHNGVSTLGWGSYGNSYFIRGAQQSTRKVPAEQPAAPLAVEPREEVEAKARPGNFSAAEIANAPECRTYPRGQDSYLCRCLPGFSQNPVWGIGPYTADSNICTAALHAGAITPRGGPVVALGAPGQDSYTGSQRNGVSTSQWHVYCCSYFIQLAQQSTPKVLAEQGNKDANRDLNTVSPDPDSGSPDKRITDPSAMFSEGVEAYKAKDFARARTLFDQACTGGNAKGCFNLSNMFAEGAGGARDKARARVLREQACKGGYTTGCYLAGTMFRRGEGGAEDKARARALFEQACKGGNNFGCYYAGTMFDTGAGGARDKARARALIEQACKGGNAAGCKLAAAMFNEKKKTLEKEREKEEESVRKLQEKPKKSRDNVRKLEENSQKSKEKDRITPSLAQDHRSILDLVVKNVIESPYAVRNEDDYSLRVNYRSKAVFSFTVRTDPKECYFHIWLSDGRDGTPNQILDKGCDGVPDAIILIGGKHEWEYRKLSDFEMRIYEYFLPRYAATFEAVNGYRSYSPDPYLGILPDPNVMRENRTLLQEIVTAATNTTLMGDPTSDNDLSDNSVNFVVFISGGVDNGGAKISFIAKRIGANRLKDCFVSTEDSKGNFSILDYNCDAVFEGFSAENGSKRSGKLAVAGTKKVVKGMLLDIGRFALVANKYFLQTK